jgi:hypothetical protein
MYKKILSECLTRREHLEDLSIGGRILLKWVLENRVVGYGLDSSVSI